MKDYHDEIIEFEYEFNDKKIIAFITKQSKDYNLPYIHCTRKQYPISLAYCLTMHKCQGQTLDGVVIIWDDIFCSGLFYSIFARCKDSNNIHIKNLDVKNHILTDREVIDLIQQKDIEFNDKFQVKYEHFPDISKYIETYLRMIRDWRISWSVIVDYITNNNENEYISFDQILNEGLAWIKTQESFLKMREDYMFEKFADNNVEGIDWRYGNERDELIETNNVIELMFVIRDDSDEDSEQEVSINNVLGLNNEIDIEVDKEISRIHNFNLDHCVPWVYWIEQLAGFECLLLVFYKCIHQKFIREHGLSIFREYNGWCRYIDILIKSLEKLSSINDMEEYCSIDHWCRFNEVFIPFMQNIKTEDSIETIIEALFYENRPFMKSITWYYDWKRNCLGNNLVKCCQ